MVLQPVSWILTDLPPKRHDGHRAACQSTIWRVFPAELCSLAASQTGPASNSSRARLRPSPRTGTPRRRSFDQCQAQDALWCRETRQLHVSYGVPLLRGHETAKPESILECYFLRWFVLLFDGLMD